MNVASVDLFDELFLSETDGVVQVMQVSICLSIRFIKVKVKVPPV